MIFSENMTKMTKKNSPPPHVSPLARARARAHAHARIDARPHLDDLPTQGRIMGVRGSQNGMATQFPKKSTYMNAIAISIGKDHLCRECKTPTDYRETGWSNGAPVMQYICPHCGIEYHPVVIEL